MLSWHCSVVLVKDVIRSGPLFWVQRFVYSVISAQPLHEWWVITVSIVQVGMCIRFSYRSSSFDCWTKQYRWNSKSLVVFLSLWTRSPWAPSQVIPRGVSEQISLRGNWKSRERETRREWETGTGTGNRTGNKPTSGQLIRCAHTCQIQYTARSSTAHEQPSLLWWRVLQLTLTQTAPLKWPSLSTDDYVQPSEWHRIYLGLHFLACFVNFSNLSVWYMLFQIQ